MANLLKSMIIAISLFSLLPIASFAQEQTNPNILLIQRFYEAYATHDAEKIGLFFSDDIVWRIPGRHPLSGEKRGKKEVVAFFSQLARANFKAEPIFFGANDQYVVDVHRGWSNAEGHPNVDTIWTLLFRINSGKIVEATNLSADQHAADNFFWSFYSLAPIPERLSK
jgi:ketosteroid isomerase-like protein